MAQSLSFNYKPTDDSENYVLVGVTTTGTSVTIPDTYQDKPVIAISDYAFANCTSLTSVVIPTSIVQIGERAFYNTKLSKINYMGSEQEWSKITGNTQKYDVTRADIEHFDLVFYPFKTVYGLNNKSEYKNSFNYTAENMEKIRADLALTKNIAHNILLPASGDIVSIKNYLQLKARVTTSKKVTLIEEKEILENIYKAIYANFNARQIELGEEIPYETIVAVLKNADYRIKDISLDEPSLRTKFRLQDKTEEDLSDGNSSSDRANELYNKLVRRNILAGRISAFQYDTAFKYDYDRTSYPLGDYKDVYPINDTNTKITKITSAFNVKDAFECRDRSKEPDADGYALKENEVIQFRVPNFKTTKTYPAYVNYFIKLNTENPGEGAIPATFETLGNFLQDKWESLVNTVAEIKDNITELVDSSDTSVSVASKEDFTKLKAAHGALFTKTGTEDDFEYSVASNYSVDQKYYYLPIKPLEGQQSIFWALNNWIKNIDYNSAPDTYEIYTPLNGIYRTVGVQEKPFGRLIDAAQYKYLPAYNFGTIADDKAALNNFYIQVTHAEDSDEVKKKEVTTDGLGQDASYTGVPKDGEYCLKTGEYLLINYTDSKTDESGAEQKTVVNKVYTEGDIIRANFNLIDSALYHTNHSYSKRDGFTFAGQQPEGMFTLGTNEQIEIREVVTVTLDDETMYLYWTLNSDDPNSETNPFTFNEDYNIDPSTRKDANGNTWGTVKEPVHNAYTLKEGEHLYYTNSKKQDLVYYGAGTLIVKNTDTPTLQKYASNGDVSEEDIMTNGLAAAIPWQPYSLGGNRGLSIIENQYVSLTEGDIIYTINNITPEASNNWTKITNTNGTVYKLAEDETKSHLAPIAVSNINWAVRSRLDFNMSQTIAQPLHPGDSLKVFCEGANSSDESIHELKPKELETGGWLTLYINSNYTCQAATDELTFIEGLDIKLKTSSQSSPKIADTEENLLLNNYINGEAKYTKFDFANLSQNFDVEKPAFKLNISVPEGKDKETFGLIAMYYIKTANEPSDDAYLVAKDYSQTGADQNVIGLSLFNTADPVVNKKYLREGLNIIKIESNVKQLEVYAPEALTDTVVFGALDVVLGINPKLDYRLSANSINKGTTKLAQLLEDLRKSNIVDDFYYNVPIQRSNEIDLNPNVADDLLSSPLAWYDPNNVNRKFVISEIDADYLSTGITLTKGSRA